MHDSSSSVVAFHAAEDRVEGVGDDLVSELALMPTVVENLLDAHIADERGRCMACTTGGTGGRYTEWPCTFRWYAERARSKSNRS